MAVRHIFYYLRESQIWWSTDLATLVLVSGDKFDIQDEYVAGYLANEPEAHLTPYRQIREVPPGQFVRISGNRQIVANRYWKFSHRSRIRYKTDAEYEEHFRHVFRQSVRRRLRSDSPILAELSGGLDSSSIVCVADDILAKEGAETSRIDTISFYDKTEPKGDDWNYFPIVEENRGSAGHHIDISKLATSPSSLEWKTFEVQPGRLADALAIEAERAEITRTGGYKVVLSGIGGDEFLGGVPDPRPQIGDLIVQFKFVGLAQQLTEWALVKRQPWIHLLWQAALDLLPPSLGQYFVKEAQVEPWIRKDFAHRTNIAIRQLDVDEHFGFYLPTRRSYIGGVVLMAKRLAKWTPPISSSEETRYPYLDQGLIEFILSIPAEQLLRPGERRSLMRRSLNRIVPKEILDRPTKQFGARTPVMALRNNVTQLQSVFDSPLSSSLGYISHPHFLRALEAADHGKPVHLVRLLKTVSLEMWLRGLAARGLIQVARASPRPATAAESVARASA
jgi:asparagine synthase (glutamine-hydrolysing)